MPVLPMEMLLLVLSHSLFELSQAKCLVFTSQADTALNQDLVQVISPLSPHLENRLGSEAQNHGEM